MDTVFHMAVQDVAYMRNPFHDVDLLLPIALVISPLHRLLTGKFLSSTNIPVTTYNSEATLANPTQREEDRLVAGGMRPCVALRIGTALEAQPM